MKFLWLNGRQWQLVYQSLVAAAGPLAKFISLFFGIDASVTKAKVDAALDLLTVITPIIGLVWMVLTSKDSDLLKNVATMKADDRANAAAKLEPEALHQIVAAMPEKTIVAAAGAMPDVKVRVGENAPAGAKEAALDANVPGVNPA